jgi:hypothetical protein
MLSLVNVLIGYEAIRYREGRAWIRSRRGAFTMEGAARAGRSQSRGRDARLAGVRTHDAGDAVGVFEIDRNVPPARSEKHVASKDLRHEELATVARGLREESVRRRLLHE